MSYAKILQTLETRPLLVPHIALAMRKPGEETGIWLFGERHDQEIPDVSGGTQLDEVLQEMTADTILLYEGYFPPGQTIFAGAPQNIINAALTLTDADNLKLLSTKHSYLPVDEEGYRQPLSDESSGDEDSDDEESVDAWDDPDYWTGLKENAGTLEFVGQKFASDGGVSVNIDNKIRKYYADMLMQHEADDALDKMDTNVLFFVVAWALHNSVRKPGRNPHLVTAVDMVTFRTKQRYMFFRDLVRSVDDRVHPLTDFHINILGEIRMLLANEPGTDRPLMLGDDYMRFNGLFIFLMMDATIHDKLVRHAGQNFVAYAGAAHTIGQYVALRHKGYVLEHAFIAPEGQNFVTPSDKRNISHETFATILQQAQPSATTDMLEFDVTNPQKRPCHRGCVRIARGDPKTYQACMDEFLGPSTTS